MHMRMSWLAWPVALWLCAGTASAGSLLDSTDGRLVVPPSPGTPLYEYEMSYPQNRLWEDAHAAQLMIGAAARPEPWRIVRLNAGRRTATIRTTPRGRDMLREAGAELTGPQDEARREACSTMFVDFTIGTIGPPDDKIITWPKQPCDYATEVDPARNLIVEGRDGRGRRLFLAVSDDPRWSIKESADAAGNPRLLHVGRTPARSASVKFTTPNVGDRLQSLAIWEVDEKGDGKRIATIAMNRK